MGMSYSGADSILNKLMQEWIIGKEIFKQAIKEDPASATFFSEWLKNRGIGENDYIKVNMGNTFQTTAIPENANWQANTGTPDIMKSSAITNKTLTMRGRVSGRLWRALRAKVMAGTSLTNGDLKDLTDELPVTFTANLNRMIVGNGTGFFCYAHNSLNTGSSTTIYIADSDGNKIPQESWIWDFLYGRVDSKVGSGMHLDICIASTGIADGVAARYDNECVSVDPSTSTIVVADAVDLSGQAAGYYGIRYTTEFSQSAVGTSQTTALYVEPMGVPGLISTTAGLHGITSQRWLSKAVNASNNPLDSMMLDNLMYALRGKPKKLMCIVDPEVCSQFEYSAQSMRKLGPDDSAITGFKGSVYKHAGMDVAFIPMNYLRGTKRLYMVAMEALRTKGTTLTPEPVRGTYEWSQTASYLIDDYISEFENVITNRNACGYIYGLAGANWTV